MRALCLPVIGFGNWDQMGMRQRVQGLVMALLEAFTRAMKNVVAPDPQSPLPKAAARTAVVSSTGTENEIGNQTETKTGIRNRTGIETERALSPGQIHSLNARPLGRGILYMCMRKT